MRGHIRGLPSGSWGIMVYLGSEGKRKKYYTETVHGSKEEAERRLTTVLKELDDQTFVPPAKMTYGEFLTKWLTDYAKISLRQTSYEMYETLIRVHIMPALGMIPLKKLTPMGIQSFLTAKALGKRADKKKGRLAPSTVKHIHDIIKISLNSAVKWGLLARNPALMADPPKVEKRRLEVWDAEQASVFWDAAKTDRYFAAYLLAITTGMRRGEVLGLRWSDLDLDRAVLRVNQQVIHTRKGMVVQEQPKTPESRRLLALSTQTVEALLDRKVAAAIERKKWDAMPKRETDRAYENNGLVFSSLDGRPLDARAFTRHFETLAAKAGLPKIRFHDLRHTNATLMIGEGVNLKIISERLGHSAIDITADKYGHVLKEFDRKVANKVEDAIREVRRKNGFDAQESPQIH